MAEVKLQNVRRKMLAVLADGLPHTRQELHACLWDEEGPLSNINIHISNIRKFLRPLGEDIACETVGGNTYYRHVRLLSSPYNGSK